MDKLTKFMSAYEKNAGRALTRPLVLFDIFRIAAIDTEAVSRQIKLPEPTARLTDPETD